MALRAVRIGTQGKRNVVLSTSIGLREKFNNMSPGEQLRSILAVREVLRSPLSCGAEKIEDRDGSELRAIAIGGAFVVFRVFQNTQKQFDADYIVRIHDVGRMDDESGFRYDLLGILFSIISVAAGWFVRDVYCRDIYVEMIGEGS